MTIDAQIRDEKLQHDINREAAKISALSSNKIGKYEYLTEEEILPSNQQQIIKKATFRKSVWKTNRNCWRSRKKQVHILKTIEDKSDDKLSLEKKTYNKLLDERTDKVRES